MMDTETKVKTKVEYIVWFYSSDKDKEQREKIEIGLHDMFSFDNDFMFDRPPIYSTTPRPEWVATHFSPCENTITNTISMSHPFRIEAIDRRTIDPKTYSPGIMYKIRAKEDEKVS